MRAEFSVTPYLRPLYIQIQDTPLFPTPFTDMKYGLTTFTIVVMIRQLIACEFQQDNGSILVTLNYYDYRERPCPCVMLTAPAPCRSSNVCVDVLFADSMRCVRWRSSLINVIVDRGFTFSCLNSSLVAESEEPVRLFCSTSIYDTCQPVEIIFEGLFRSQSSVGFIGYVIVHRP